LSFYKDPAKPEHWKFRIVQLQALTLLEEFRKRDEVRNLVPPPSVQETEAGIRFRLATLKPGQPIEPIILAEKRLGLHDLLRRDAARAALAALAGKDSKHAENELRRIREEARTVGDIRTLQYVSGNFGYELANKFRLDEANALFVELLQLGEKYGDLAVQSLTQTNLGWIHQLMGHEERAIQYHEAAEQGLRTLGRTQEQRRSLRNLGSIYFARGDYAKAAGYFATARQAIRPESDPGDVAGLMSDLAANAIELGNVAEAAQALDRAQAFEGHKRLFEYPWILLTKGKIAERRGEDPLPMYELAATFTGGDHTAPLEARLRMADYARRNGKVKVAEFEYKKAIQAVAELRKTLSQEDSKIGFASTVMRIYKDYVDLLVEDKRDREALLVADSSRNQVFREAYAGERLDLNRLSAILGKAKTTILFYWTAPKRSFLWILDGNGARLAPQLASSFVINKLVREYSDFIRNGGDPKESDFEAPRRLWEELIQKPGLGDSAATAMERVIIVPDGSLHWLNFETLPLPGRKGPFWVERSQISVAPSLWVLSSGANRGATAGTGRGTLLIGDPEPAPDYPRLRNVAHEMDDVAKLFSNGTPSSVIRKSGSDAKPETYGAVNPGHFEWIHFAAHAESNAQSPLDSAVILSSGTDGNRRLYARQVLKYPLKARLVTLSACSAAGSKAYEGEGLVGFSWAFLRAGARQVLAGLWLVDDGSADELMTAFYEKVHSRTDPVPALREAKLAIIARGGAYAKPYYWGPFQIFTSAVPSF
jgi:CHAT domain-containing protein/tetratricopeptide (TPR) repeat protein